MSFIEILLMALSLSVDTLAVSMSGSVSLGKVTFWKTFGVAAVFGTVQASFLAAGWLFGHSIVTYIERFAGIVGFLLLLYIGGSMIYGALKKGECENADLSGFRKLLLAGVATSIDAVAVGLSFSMAATSGFGTMFLTVGTVFVVTMAVAATGVAGGCAIGKRFGKTAQFIGGLVLIGIGIRLLIG